MSKKEYVERGEMLSALRSGFFPQDVEYTEAVSIAAQIISAAPAADVVPRSEVELLKRQLEPFKKIGCHTCKHFDVGHDHVPCCYCCDSNKYVWLGSVEMDQN